MDEETMDESEPEPKAVATGGSEKGRMGATLEKKAKKMAKESAAASTKGQKAAAK